MSSKNAVTRYPVHKQVVVLISLCLFSAVAVLAQPYKWNISATFHLPVGTFSETHFPGAGVEAAYSQKRFGRLPAIPKKKFSYIVTTGIDFFRGRKVTASGYPFKYGGYSLLHLYGGAVYNYKKHTNVQLVAGPALSRYKQNIRFNIGSLLSATYFVSGRTGITPSFGFINEWGAVPLWYGSVKVSKAF